jgi:glycosyltransferase involved in cell wall biosynthesis
VVVPVSVVIPAYNRAELLPRAITSVLTQRPEPPVEVIVVDDGSSDATADTATRLGARVVRHERNLGESAARNTGIGAASQEWIALLDSDDEWLPHHLATLWPLRDNHALVGGATLWLGAGSRSYGFGGTLRPTAVSPQLLIFPENFLSCDAVLVRKDVVQAAGGFNPEIRYGADMDLWIRVLERGTGIAVPAVVAIWHLHPGQVTADRREMWAGRERIIRAYAARRWWSTRLLDQARAVNAWDSCRLALRRGELRRVMLEIAFIAEDPVRLSAVAQTWIRRQRLKRRAAAINRTRRWDTLIEAAAPRSHAHHSETA